MVFGRRKSAIYSETTNNNSDEGVDGAMTKGRCLSKPRTIGSSTTLNLNGSSVHQIMSGRASSSMGRKDLVESFPRAKSNEALEKENMSESDRTRPTLKSVRSNGVSMMISRFENGYTEQNASQSSVDTLKQARRPTSRLFVKGNLSMEKKSSQTLDSKDRLSTHSRISPASSNEHVVNDPAPRPRRIPSFTPGVATRVPSVQHDDQERSMNPEVSAVAQAPHEDQPRSTVIDSISDWIPPPCSNRPETPQGLDYTHLGSHGLGSLTVTNGRVSPALSDRSKQLVNVKPGLRRDESSQYAPSELGTIRFSGSDWADETLPSETNTDPAQSVAETIETGEWSTVVYGQPRSSLTEKLRQLSPIETPASPKADGVLENPDITAQLARSYMDELEETPYTDHSRSASLESVIRHEEQAGGERSFLQEREASSPVSRVHSSPPHPREAPPAVPTEPPVPPLITQESYLSFYSAREPIYPEYEIFESALELQPMLERIPAEPELLARTRTAPPALTDSHVVRDSGYSSNTSLTPSIPVALEKTPSGEAMITPSKKSGFRMPFMRKGKDPQGAVLVSPALSKIVSPVSSARRDTASERTIPSRLTTLADVIPTDPPISLPVSPNKTAEKQRRKLVKTRRKSTVDIANDIVVTRLSSGELFDVPSVSPGARGNLAARAELVPELNSTYKTHHHIRNQDNESVSSLPLALPPPRFPSPTRGDDGTLARPVARSRSRSRSLSRPRLTMRPKSWFGFGRDSVKDRLQAPVALSPTHLDDLGDVLDLLGGNPYDIANDHGSARPSRSNSMRQVSPFNISNHNTRRRSMMDDEAASNLSKLRRKSWHEKDRYRDKSPAVDDRGGLPGKNIHTQEAGPDVPPIPPMPSQDEIARRMSARYSYGISFHSRQHDPEALYSEPNSILAHAYPSDAAREDQDVVEMPSSPPPPPPPSHSPRPQYVDEEAIEDDPDLLPSDVIEPMSEEPQQESVYSTQNELSSDLYAHLQEELDSEHVNGYDQYEPRSEDAPAPPPPSHSPRPTDITSSHSLRYARRSPKLAAMSSRTSPSGHRYVSYEEDWGVESAEWRRGPYGVPRSQYNGDWRRNEPEGSYPSIPPRKPVAQHNPRNDVSRATYGGHTAAPQRHPYSAPHDHDQHHSYNGYNGYEQQHQHYPARHHQQQQQHQHQPVQNQQHRIPRRPLPQQRHTVHEDFFAHELDQQHMYNHPGYDSAYLHGGTMHDPYVTNHQQRSARPQSHSPNRQPGPQSPNRIGPYQAQRPQHQLAQYQYVPPNHYMPMSQMNQQPLPPRASSRHSNISNHSHRSLAEELHPEREDDRAANYENAPQFGRYSGGFEYMGGSAGSRSVSGKQMANVGRKSFEDRERYGIDLDDVPAMTVGRGVENRMVYT